MEEVSIIGIDLAKRSFQVHGAKADGSVADAEGITEAAQRPTMHFVAVKTEAQQAQAMLFHTRDLLVRQRTQTINARECEETARLMTIPGVGPITALAIQAFAPPMESFRRPDSASCRDSTPPAASRGWAGYRRWASGI